MKGIPSGIVIVWMYIFVNVKYFMFNSIMLRQIDAVSFDEPQGADITATKILIPV